MGRRLSRRAYAELFGPTTGDRIRLGDSDLWAEVERDLLVPGDECVFGGGKTLRDGMGTSGSVTAAEGALDFVITNVVLVDAVLGIVKADIGIKDGRIVGVGKAGNPQIMDGVTPGMTIGANTDVRSAEGMIATAGRDRRARALRLGGPLRGGHLERRDDDDRRWPRAGHRRHHLVGHRQPGPHAAGRRGVPAQLRLPRQGLGARRRAPARAGRGRLHRPQDPRGLGRHARRWCSRRSTRATSSTSRCRSTRTR